MGRARVEPKGKPERGVPRPLRPYDQAHEKCCTPRLLALKLKLHAFRSDSRTAFMIDSGLKLKLCGTLWTYPNVEAK
jgi:hypothetical protein